MTKKLLWYYNRLRAMSVSEIVYRLILQRRKMYWRRNLEKLKNSKPEVRFSQEKLNLWQPTDLPENLSSTEVQALLAEADCYLKHQWLFFGLKDTFEPDIDWHADPVAGKAAPQLFGFDVNHKDDALVGDIKNTWEKSRLHHLSVLAAAYRVSGEEKYAAECCAQIHSWMEQNPYLVGVNWTHPLEHGIRLITWVWCERLLRGSESHGDVFCKGSPFWVSVYHHQKFIVETYSKGSSANNHLIGEMAGLYVAALAWPFFKESKQWAALGKREIETEAASQTFSSGLNKEQAFSYHLFVLEFLMASLVEATIHGDTFSDAFTKRMRDSLEVIPVLTDGGGNLPRYGDSDEGMVLLLQAAKASKTTWLFELGAALLRADVPVGVAMSLPTSLLGYKAAENKPEEAPDHQISVDDAGLFILSQGKHTDEEIWLMADAGPLGFLSIAAHGHADALHFDLSVAGVPMIVNPGTYSYHTQQDWREYFRSVHAHNTISVDGLDQSEQTGPFMWNRKAEAWLESWKPEEPAFAAAHDGYKHIGVMHKRHFSLKNRIVTLTDTLEGNGTHAIESRLHFHPESIVDLDGTVCTVTRNDVSIKIQTDPQFDASLEKETPTSGWYSESYNQKTPAYTLIMKGTMRGDTIFTTTISC